MNGYHVEETTTKQEDQIENDSKTTKNLLVFWPDDARVPANHLGSNSADRSSEDGFLVGKLIKGHASEMGVVVHGIVAAQQLDRFREYGLIAIGHCCATPGCDGAEKRLSSGLAPVWIETILSRSPHGMPTLSSIHFPATRLPVQEPASSREAAAQCSVRLIRYTVPNSRMLQYYSLEPLRLGPVSGLKLIALGSLLIDDAKLFDYSQAARDVHAASVLERKLFQLLLLDPARWHELKHDRPDRGSYLEGTALRRSIDHVNRTQPLLGQIASSASHSPAPQLPTKRDSASRRTTSFTSIVEVCLLTVKAILHHPLPIVPVSDVLQVRPSLVVLLATARQLDVRLSQLLIAPRLASRLRTIRKEQKLPTDEIAAPYIGLWNAVWLIANDIILGNAMSVVLLQYNCELSWLARTYFERYFLNFVLWLLNWLGDWPAGLKLNTELSLFFGDAYSSLTASWNAHVLSLLLPRLDSIVLWIAFAGRLFGVTMVLCLIQDLVAICTFHITVFYTLSFRTMRFFVYVLSALFDLFRGKKRNALRGGRLDNASYELDQLLLGTILFTLVAFLFPTVYIYYLAFGLMRLSVVGFDAAFIETWLGLLNHLPLFALMLRVKDPHRLPAGVYLQKEREAHGERTCTVTTGICSSDVKIDTYTLRSRPLSLGAIFEGYGEHVGGIAELPKMMLRCLYGQPLRQARHSQSTFT